jgi:beta-lactamase class A
MGQHDADAERAIADAVDRFAVDDAGRSIAVRCRQPIASQFHKNADTPRPAASVMKLPIVMAILQTAAAGGIDLEEKLRVSVLPHTRYVSILAGFDPAHELSLREMCRLSLITSDNPMMVELQKRISYAEINAFMRDIGLSAACRIGAGFSESELGPANRQNTVTARDCLTILEEIGRNAVHRDVLLALQNNLRNNRIPAKLPDSAIVAHKTGSLNGVVNDIGTVTDDAIEFSIAFLTDGQSAPDETANDMALCTSQIYTCLRRVCACFSSG